MSFIQKASTRILDDNLRNRNRPTNSRAHQTGDFFALSEVSRWLLVEDESESKIATNCVSSEQNILTQSLAMDYMYSLVSTSPFGCRGCYQHLGNSTDDARTEVQSRGLCKCCKVAFLVPMAPGMTRKKRHQSGSTQPFPLCFLHNAVERNERLSPTILEKIHIKYVSSLAEVIQFLVYVTSLPDHLQPLDGICLLGVGLLLPKKNINTEMTHLVAMLSHTADALEEKGRSLIQMTSDQSVECPMRHRRCSIVTTIDMSTYTLIHRNVVRYLYNWVHFIYVIRAVQGDAFAVQNDTATSSSQWELVYKNFVNVGNLSGISKNPTEHDKCLSFSVRKVLGNESNDELYELIWNE